MSRLSNTFTKHRKDNYSLDIKGIYRSGQQHHPLHATPFAKKKQDNLQFFTRLKTQVTHNNSMHLTEKEGGGGKQKRRFSLTKTFKMNNSVGIENHLSKQKIKRVYQLLAQQKYEECLSLLRQMLMRQQNLYMKTHLYWLNANCLKKIGKIKEAEHFLTRMLNDDQDNYEGLVERAKVRYLLGAKQLSIRDLRHAIYVDQSKQQAYIELCSLYLQQGEQKQAYSIACSAIEKGLESPQLLINIIQLLLTNNTLVLSSDEKANFYITKLREQTGTESKDSADLLYLQALLFETRGKLTEACIYYEECLKFNNSRIPVTKAMERLILIKIQQRDYYSAYHTVNRYRILNIETGLIRPYILFLEGVILIMKKKFIDGIRLFDIIIEISQTGVISQRAQLLLQTHLKSQSLSLPSKPLASALSIKLHHKYKNTITPLMLKFNAYAAYKIGNHDRSIEYYDKLGKWGMDECSSYNLLLAEGILAVQKKKNFQQGIQKFQQARYIYPCKVEPNIYIAMTIIYRDLCISGMLSSPNIESQTLTSAIIHAMEQLNEAHETINDGSSNLLYHRCILSLYMEDWDAALGDINLCIEKAEENQPKYFYLRGLCYAVVKDLKKAINQYSISLSLDSQYHRSLLQRAKCYFLLGQTESGFSDLKQYMYKNQTDYQVHKWIGDLLYEGRSYNDAYKAYTEIEESISFETEIMKCKCLLRVAELNKLSDCLTKLSKLEECEGGRVEVDVLAVNLLRILGKNHESKEIGSKIKKLNGMLEGNCVGYIFGLIDCMGLLGLATFDAGRYEEAYQSFLLVLQLYSNLADKNKSELKSDCSEEGLSLSLQDIYLNIIYCLLGMKDYDSAAKMMGTQLLSCSISEKLVAKISKILHSYHEEQSSCEVFTLQPDNPKNDKLKFKQVSLKMKNLRIKCTPIFAPFHICVQDLYSKTVAQRIIRNLKPSYIDNMPEGPWIKRNQHGVIFTDHVLDDGGSSDFLSSMRAKQSEEVSEMQYSRRSQEIQKEEQYKREEFKRKMQLDRKMQEKLNNIINKSQR